MRSYRKFQRMLIHICTICSMVIIAVHVLDWYNPFMDFSGHATAILYLLCGAAILSGVLQIGAGNRR